MNEHWRNLIYYAIAVMLGGSVGVVLGYLVYAAPADASGALRFDRWADGGLFDDVVRQWFGVGALWAAGMAYLARGR